MILFNPKAAATVIHRLHPFSKMAAGAGFSILALCFTRPVALSVLLVFVLMILIIARVRLTYRQWLSIFLFLFVMSMVNYLASQDMEHTATYSMRFAIFLTAMPLLAVTTAPEQMTQALSRTPLPGGVVMALMLVWRFFPLMVDEARQMRQAALLRRSGAEGAAVRIYRGLLIPLAFCVIAYTDRITLALELRGFTPNKRRTYRQRCTAGVHDAWFSMAALGAGCFAGWLQWGAW